MTIHTVAPGQTLNAIAGLYGVGAGLIAEYNGLAPPYALAVGQSLLIPAPTALYTVRSGDTLTGIAARNGLSVSALLGREEPEVNADPELTEYLQQLRDRPELRMLFSLTKNATKQDVEAAVRIIEALRAPDADT